MKPIKSSNCLCFVWFTLLLAYLPLYAIAEEAEKKKPIAWIEGSFYDILSTDHRSASFVNELGEHIAYMSQRHLKVGSHDFQKRVLVTLYPEGHLDWNEHYQIKVSPRGQISLNFRWDESLSFETTCFAMTEAYLMNYSRFNYGANAYEKIRFWATSVVFSRNYLSLRPAQKFNFIRAVRSSTIPRIETLLSSFTAAGTDEKAALYQGYILFQILRESGQSSNSQLSELLDLAIAGIDVTNQVTAQVSSKNNETAEILLEEWWQNQATNYLSQSHEYYDTLEATKSWIEGIKSFVAYRESGGKLKDLMGLWAARDDTNLREILTARCELIRLRIGRINPAYFNTALSLGALYETVLEAEKKHEFIKAVTSFLNDWEDTKRLHSRAVELTAGCD